MNTKYMMILAFLLLTTWAKAQKLTPGQEKEIGQAFPGQVIHLAGYLEQSFPEMAYQKMVLPGPQFLISDDPEYIRTPEAIVLKEKVNPGAVRLYLYNVNGVITPQKMPRKITAVIKNLGRTDLHLRMLKSALQKPSSNYFEVGKKGLRDYFSAQGDDQEKVIAPLETIALDPKLETQVVNYDQLVHGIYEFVIDQPAEIAVLQTATDQSGPQAYNSMLPVIPPGHKNAGRGLFGVSNYAIQNLDTLDTQQGVAMLTLADGKTDTWIEGREANTGQLAHLSGNYGVMYDITLHWKSSNGKGLALITWNARADQKWCSGMANTMVVGAEDHQQIVSIPRDQLMTNGAPEAVVIQVFKPVPDQEVQTIKLKYSPPGASCLPTPLLLVPISLGSK